MGGRSGAFTMRLMAAWESCLTQTRNRYRDEEIRIDLQCVKIYVWKYVQAFS